MQYEKCLKSSVYAYSSLFVLPVVQTYFAWGCFEKTDEPFNVPCGGRATNPIPLCDQMTT